MNNLENKFYIHEVFLKLVFSLFNKEEYILSEQVQEIDCWTFFLMEFGIILCQGCTQTPLVVPAMTVNLNLTSFLPAGRWQ